MTGAAVILTGFRIHRGACFFCGRKIARDVVRASDEVYTPSGRLYDGVDCVPARGAVRRPDDGGRGFRPRFLRG